MMPLTLPFRCLMPLSTAADDAENRSVSARFAAADATVVDAVTRMLKPAEMPIADARYRSDAACADTCDDDCAAISMPM
jgi:hypothetical protein